jgi:hypothetical protein
MEEWVIVERHEEIGKHLKYYFITLLLEPQKRPKSIY